MIVFKKIHKNLSVLKLISCLFYIFAHISFITNSFCANISQIQSIIERINYEDGAHFARIFRDDIVIVTRKGIDPQVDRVFGLERDFLKENLSFAKNLLKKCLSPLKYSLALVVKPKFKRSTRVWPNYIDKDGKLQSKTQFFVFLEHLQQSIQQAYEQIRFQISIFLSNLLYNEVFIYKVGNKFEIEEFQNVSEKNENSDCVKFFTENKQKNFFFLDELAPFSHIHCENKHSVPNALANHFYYSKLRNIREITQIARKMVDKTQSNVFKRATFFLLRSFLISDLKSIGVNISLTFSGIDISVLNLSIDVLSYDKPSYMMTYWYKNTEQWILRMFQDINYTFRYHSENIQRGDNKIKWSTAYINDILEIFAKYSVLKKRINIKLYPEIISALFPYEFFFDSYQTLAGECPIRSVIDFTRLEDLEKFEEYFDTGKIEQIRKVTGQFMTTFF